MTSGGRWFREVPLSWFHAGRVNPHGVLEHQGGVGGCAGSPALGVAVAAVRILVADSSQAVRHRLREALSRVSGFEVVGEAADGEGAVEACRRLRPDVVLLELALPGLNGLEATARILAERSLPILILCTAEQRAGSLVTLDAMGAGAAAVVGRPTDTCASGWEDALVARVRLAARMTVSSPRLRPPVPVEHRLKDGPRPFRVVAMGASTGGPQAVGEVLRALPRDFHLPVLLVLHVSERFDGGMASWLSTQTGLPVRYATDGEPLPVPGCRPGVWMAPAGRHLVLRGGLLRLEEGPERHASRPSVDVLFESLAREVGAGALGCLLTGMGRDGAEGLAALRRAGAPTLAQDEATSAVFGMPQEAIRLGAATRVAALRDIAPWLSSLAALARPRSERRTA